MTLDTLTATQIVRRRDWLGAKVDAAQSALIRAGRGSERVQETLAKADPLALAFNVNFKALQEVYAEMNTRKRYSGTFRPIRRAS